MYKCIIELYALIRKSGEVLIAYTANLYILVNHNKT